MTPQQRSRTEAAGRPGVDETVEAFERFIQVVSSSHAPTVVETSLSMAQMKVLYILGAQREIHMSELVPILGVSLSTVSGLVDRLVDAGLAGRREDPIDRRHVFVAVTPAGDDLLDRFRELGTRQFRSLLDGLSAAEIASVHAAIDLLTTAAARKDPT
jgi:DNA-binding MarR family transcriptional regulator